MQRTYPDLRHPVERFIDIDTLNAQIIRVAKINLNHRYVLFKWQHLQEESDSE
jgi:hypothetical protein